MGSLRKLVTRDDSTMTPTMVNLLIALLILVFIGLCCVGTLFVLRNRRRTVLQHEEAALPLYDEKDAPSSRSHHRLTISTSRNSSHHAVHVYNEKQGLIDTSSPSSASPVLMPDSVPEIRITFPEEEDDHGRPKSGRVVVVHVGDTGVGLEPMEGLPPYSQADSDRYQSLDLDRIGGLKEMGYSSKI